jgi:hypothetical protein
MRVSMNVLSQYPVIFSKNTPARGARAMRRTRLGTVSGAAWLTTQVDGVIAPSVIAMVQP